LCSNVIFSNPYREEEARRQEETNCREFQEIGRLPDHDKIGLFFEVIKARLQWKWWYAKKFPVEIVRGGISSGTS
jgi:hypothetical protein